MKSTVSLAIVSSVSCCAFLLFLVFQMFQILPQSACPVLCCGRFPSFSSQYIRRRIQVDASRQSHHQLAKMFRLPRYGSRFTFKCKVSISAFVSPDIWRLPHGHVSTRSTCSSLHLTFSRAYKVTVLLSLSPILTSMLPMHTSHWLFA